MCVWRAETLQGQVNADDGEKKAEQTKHAHIDPLFTKI